MSKNSGFAVLTLIVSRSTALQAVLLQDRVQSYFGMRKISLGKVPGESNPRIMLNNMFLFQMGVLDQVSTPAHKLTYDVWHWSGLAFLLCS